MFNVFMFIFIIIIIVIFICFLHTFRKRAGKKALESHYISPIKIQ